MNEILIDVSTASSVKAFLPFTALPDQYAGKQVKIVLCDEQSMFDEENLELPF